MANINSSCFLYSSYSAKKEEKKKNATINFSENNFGELCLLKKKFQQISYIFKNAQNNLQKKKDIVIPVCMCR